MAYVGTPIDTQNQFQSLQGKRFSGNGSTTAFTLDIAPSSVFDIEVFVENVRQDPNSAYGISGTTLTFAAAPASGTNNIYVVHQAKAVGTISAGEGTVQASSFSNDAISGHTALAATPADTDEFLVSDAGTIKRIDYSVLGSTPAFEAHSASNQTISNNTYTKVTLGTEIFDSDGKFASNKFTPTVAGKYFVYGSVRLQVDASQMNFGQCSIYKNGSLYAERIIDFRNNNGTQMNVDIATTIDMDSDDYVELYAKILYGGGSEIFITTDNKGSHFGAYRLIGV